jgi:IS605 OrfB family transposase
MKKTFQINFQSLLPDNIRYSKKLRKLDSKRNRQVEDYLNKAVKTLIDKVKELNVYEVIIGYNKNIKKGGIKNDKLKGKNKRRINQNFVSIPLSRFKDKLIFKCRQNGIEVTTISESTYQRRASMIMTKLKRELIVAKELKEDYTKDIILMY